MPVKITPKRSKSSDHQSESDSDDDNGSDSSDSEKAPGMVMELESNLSELMEAAIQDLEMTYQPRIFRHTALKNFLSTSLAQLNPDLSLAHTTVDYYSEIFLKYIFDRACFSFWKVKNDKVDFEGWPEALKMDHFLEQTWNENYENELTFLYK